MNALQTLRLSTNWMYPPLICIRSKMKWVQKHDLLGVGNNKLQRTIQNIYATVITTKGNKKDVKEVKNVDKLDKGPLHKI